MTSQSLTDSRPKVLVVGAPGLGDILRNSPAQWEVQPVSGTVNAMWDAIEAGTLDSAAQIVIFSDGTGNAPDELESTIAAFAPFSTTFVAATPERAAVIIERARTMASTVPNGNPNAPIHAMPIHDVKAALDFLRTVLGDTVTWASVSEPVTPNDTLATSAPVVASPSPTASGGYEQAQVYSPDVVNTANNSIPKPPNARPGQMTIASMSSKGGSGKCLKYDTLIINPDTGIPQTVEDIVQKFSMKTVASFDGETITEKTVANRMFSGHRQTWKLTTATGRHVIATGTHPLLGRGGWKPLETFAAGEPIAVPGKMLFPTTPVTLDNAELDILAVATAKAQTRSNSALDDWEGFVGSIIERAAVEVHKNLPVEASLVTATPIAVMKPRKHIVDIATKTTMAKHGVVGSSLPLAAFRINETQLSRFLTLYWMTAGRVTVSGDASVVYNNRTVAAMMQHLLLRFGVITKIESVEDGFGKTLWHLNVARGSLGLFAEKVPLWGPKGDNLEANKGPACLDDIYWDTVDSIVPDEMARVYDIEVPETRNFVANDIIVHNSTTAALLAGTIAKSSAAAGKPLRVVLVDLDTRDGQVGSLIGKYMPTSINIRVMPEWNAETVTANLVHDSRLGIDALLAPVRPRNADDVGAEFYRHIIGVLQTTHDVIILDCSVNYLDPLLGTAFAMSDEILFVTTLATTSVQGMARSLTELFADPADGGLGIPKEKVGIVANQVIKNVGMGKDKLLRAALGAPLVGQIPSDQDAVLVATNSNRLSDLLQHPRLGPAYFRLAVNCLPNRELKPLTVEQVNATMEQAAQAEQKRGLFKRG